MRRRRTRRTAALPWRGWASVPRLVGGTRSDTAITGVRQLLGVTGPGKGGACHLLPRAAMSCRAEWGWFALGTALALSGCGADETDEPVHEGAPESAPQETLGIPGAHVWFDTSSSVSVQYTWFRSGPASVTPMSGGSCAVFRREAMSEAQLDALEELVLVPLTPACFTDGHFYHDLVVTDPAHGTLAYRTTGCEYLKLAGATAMLPSSFDPALFPADDGEPCAP